MCFPIQYAVPWPERVPNDLRPLDFAQLGALHFEAPRTQDFPALDLARQAGETGGTLPAVLNAAKVDQGLTVFVRVWLQKQDAETVNRFTRAVMQLPQVVECHLMAGDCDFLLRIVVSNLEQYRQFQTDNLGQIEGIQNMKTEIPMQLIKQTLELPI